MQEAVDKTAFSVASLFEPSDEKQFWLSKTPYERLRAVEAMRKIIYGKDLNDLENLPKQNQTREKHEDKTHRAARYYEH